MPREQGEGNSGRALQEGGGDERREAMPISRVQGVEESTHQIQEALFDAVDAAEQELGSGYMATVWKRLEKRSRDGYVAGIRR